MQQHAAPDTACDDIKVAEHQPCNRSIQELPCVLMHKTEQKRTEDDGRFAAIRKQFFQNQSPEKELLHKAGHHSSGEKGQNKLIILRVRFVRQLSDEIIVMKDLQQIGVQVSRHHNNGNSRKNIKRRKGRQFPFGPDMERTVLR